MFGLGETVIQMEKIIVSAGMKMCTGNELGQHAEKSSSFKLKGNSARWYGDVCHK